MQILQICKKNAKMQKCKKHKKYKSAKMKNTWAPAISTKKQNRVKTQKTKNVKT